MRSNSSESDVDLTARARIRAAAVRLFGSGGFADTGVRAIAAAAGVSAGLVLHHYGSKEGLKLACDEYVAGELVDTEVASSEQDLVGAMRRWLAEPDAYQAEFDYLTRMLLESSDTSDQLFDALVDRTEKMLREGIESGQMNRVSDIRTTALVVALSGLAPLVLGRQVSRALGEDSLNARALQRLALPVMELYTHGLYATPELLEATKAAMEGEA